MPDTIYTGKGLTPDIKSDGGKAMSRLSDFIVKAEELKYSAFKENKNWLLKMADVEPAMLISNANQETQRKLYDVFKNEAAAIYKETNGMPSSEQQQEIIFKRNFMIAEQNKLLAKEKLAEQHKAMVSQNPLKYKREEFNKEYNRLLTEGEYDLITPPLRPKDFAGFLNDQSKRITDKLPFGTVKNEFGEIADQFTNIKEEDITDFIKRNLFVDEQASLGVLEEWSSLPMEEKVGYLEDTNNDNVIDEKDEDENAIEKWAVNNPRYRSAAQKITTGGYSKLSTSTSGKNLGISISFGGKDNVIAPVGTKRSGSIKYGGIDRPNLYDFGGTFVLSSVPTPDGAYLLSDVTEKIDGVTNVSGQLVDYDADRDTIIIRATAGIPGVGADTKQLIEVPAGSIEGINNLPIKINGKQVTLGVLRGTKGGTTTTAPDKWSKYKRPS